MCPDGNKKMCLVLVQYYSFVSGRLVALPSVCLTNHGSRDKAACDSEHDISVSSSFTAGH